MSDTYLPGDTRQRIQDLIKSKKITQAELAESIGLSSAGISRGGQRTWAMVSSSGSPNTLMCRRTSFLAKRIFRTGRIMI